MPPANSPPTLSVVLIAPDADAEPPALLVAAGAAGSVSEVVRAFGPFDQLAAAFADAAAQCGGDLVLVLTPDAELAPGALAAIAVAAVETPEADAFTLTLAGLAADPAWRGRRCRSHERNLESLRFASLIAAGALAVRRRALLAALAKGPLPASGDWWRELTRRVCREARVVALAASVRRSGWLAGEPPCPGFAPPMARPHVLVFGQIEVSSSLYFDFLEAAPEVATAFRAPTRLAVDAPHLAAADLVILVRTLHRFWDEGAIAFLEAAGTPWVWFTDDNFQALAAEHDAPTFFAAARLRRALAGAAEVWASTPALAAALDDLHPRVGVWGPVLDPLLAAAPAPVRAGGLTIGLPGGDFRVGGLAGAVAARLQALCERGGLRLVATEAAAAALAPALPGAEIIALPMQRSFRQFIRNWRRFDVDILLHPAGATANAAYKCPTAAIVAGYLGAAPLVADEPAYAGWAEPEGLLTLDADAAGLVDAAGLATDGAWRGRMRQRLGDALATRFASAGRAGRLLALMRPASAAAAPAAAVLAAPGFARRRTALGVARLTRRIRDALARPG